MTGQADAQEIYSGEVDSDMIAAGMRAYREFESCPDGPSKTRAEMVARIYAAMEEIKRRSGESGQEGQPSVEVCLTADASELLAFLDVARRAAEAGEDVSGVMHLTEHDRDVELAVRDRPVADDIEVTPEMIEAGFDAALANYAFWSGELNEEELREAIKKIFRAMIASAQRAAA